MIQQCVASRSRLIVAAALLALVALTGIKPADAASARKVVEMTTPGGINAWLVEERSIPLVSIRFTLTGGALQDPDGREGLGGLMTSLLTEGGGDLNAEAYARQLADQGTQISVSIGRDQITGGFDSLKRRLDASAELLRIAIAAPRFDAEAIERVRRQRIADLENAENEPRSVAFNRWYAETYKGTPYGRPINGTPASLKPISRDDIEKQHKRLFTRDVLHVVIVGDIDRQTAARILDLIFAGLPANGTLPRVPNPEPRQLAKPIVITKELPLSTAAFGTPALQGDDPAFPALQVLNQIIGSGDFDSTLMDEIRVKRGLAYAVSTSLLNEPAAPVMLGGMSTKNENMAQAMGVLRDVLAGIAAKGPTPAQFENAKQFLTGSYVLDFDTNAKLAGSLLRIWGDGKRPQFIETRNATITRVTLDDVRRVARDMLAWDRFNVVIVGKPAMPN